jgi:UDP-sugar pyrophosphorylase
MKLQASGMQVTESPTRSIRGVPITSGPRVILRPTFALTLAEVTERFQSGSISGDSTLILDGDIRLENTTISNNTSLIIHAAKGSQVTVKNLTVSGGAGFRITELTEAEMASSDVPEYLRIRGYRIIGEGVQKYTITQPGKWILHADGTLEPDKS